MTDRPPAERAELEVAATRELGRLREEFARHREAWGVKRAELAGHVTELLTDQKGLRSKVATLTAERDAAREEVAMGRKAMGILAFELERMKAERDAARQQLEDLAYSHSLCGDLRDECINAETEACAQLANWHLNNIERLRPSANDGWLKGYRDACADLESAIRARGAK